MVSVIIQVTILFFFLRGHEAPLPAKMLKAAIFTLNQFSAESSARPQIIDKAKSFTIACTREVHRESNYFAHLFACGCKIDHRLDRQSARTLQLNKSQELLRSFFSRILLKIFTGTPFQPVFVKYWIHVYINKR